MLFYLNYIYFFWYLLSLILMVVKKIIIIHRFIQENSYVVEYKACDNNTARLIWFNPNFTV